MAGILAAADTVAADTRQAGFAAIEYSYLSGIAMDTPPVIKPSLFKQVIALLLYFLVCGLFAIPSLSLPGAVTAKYKITLFLLVLIRLSWSVYSRTFRLPEYLIYFAVVIAFCVMADFCADWAW
jgi:hypothetical protein